MRIKENQNIKLVFNALAYKKNSSGIGVMLRELCEAYSHVIERPCWAVIPRDSPEFSVGENASLFRIPWAYSDSLRRLWFQTFSLGQAYCRDAVLLTSDSKCPVWLPKSCILLPLITDLAVYRMPEVYQRSRALLWRLQYRYVRRRANAFLAISEFTKREMVELWRVPPEKIHVVPCAYSPCLTREINPDRLSGLRKKYNLPEQFALFVGNANPRKNLSRLIRAFDLAKTEAKLPHQLIIAGEQGWKFDREQAMRGIEHQRDVLFIGFVPDEDMSALYSAASLFVFPSLYEGFGIPILEAQTCGTPVLTSKCSSLPEVGGAGAFYIDPYDIKSIADGIQTVLTKADVSRYLVLQGFQNVKRFSWEQSARRLNEIIENELKPQGVREWIDE